MTSKKTMSVSNREALLWLLFSTVILFNFGLLNGRICAFSLKNSQEGNELQVKACPSNLLEKDPISPSQAESE